MARTDLEQARIRLYEKADRSKLILGISTALLVCFGFVAFLNLIGSVQFSFRADQRNLDRFLDWLVIVAYLVWIVHDGLKRTKSADEIDGYLLAKRSLPWWAAGLSVMATQFRLTNGPSRRPLLACSRPNALRCSIAASTDAVSDARVGAAGPVPAPACRLTRG